MRNFSEQFKVHANRELDSVESWDISFLPLFDSPVNGQGDDETIGTFFIRFSGGVQELTEPALSEQYFDIISAFFRALAIQS
jgi:hypothetical protein